MISMDGSAGDRAVVTGSPGRRRETGADDGGAPQALQVGGGRRGALQPCAARDDTLLPGAEGGVEHPRGASSQRSTCPRRHEGLPCLPPVACARIQYN